MVQTMFLEALDLDRLRDADDNLRLFLRDTNTDIVRGRHGESLVPRDGRSHHHLHFRGEF